MIIFSSASETEQSRCSSGASASASIISSFFSTSTQQTVIDNSLYIKVLHQTFPLGSTCNFYCTCTTKLYCTKAQNVSFTHFPWWLLRWKRNAAGQNVTSRVTLYINSLLLQHSAYLDVLFKNIGMLPPIISFIALSIVTFDVLVSKKVIMEEIIEMYSME